MSIIILAIILAIVGLYLVCSGVSDLVATKNPIIQLLNLSRQGKPLIYNRRVNNRVNNPLVDLLNN